MSIAMRVRASTRYCVIWKKIRELLIQSEIPVAQGCAAKINGKKALILKDTVGIEK